MLDEYKKIYEQSANLIPNWKDLSKSEIANLYLTSSDLDRESYLSALICKYWNLISLYYSKQTVKIAKEENCYDWLIEGLLEALRRHVWTDKNNSLYGDKKGPEKAIAVCIASTRITYFQYTNRAKRYVNYTIYSLDSMEEECSDGYYLPYYDKLDINIKEIEDNIKSHFLKKDYFYFYTMDAILHSSVIDTIQNCISIKKLKKHLNNIDKRYCSILSDIYHIPVLDILNSLRYVQNLDDKRIIRSIHNIKKDIIDNNKFFNLIKGV